MALYRKIPAGDIEFEVVNGKLRPRMVTGAEYTKIKIAQRLKFFLGEWFRDKRQGVPYFRDVFVKNPDVDLIRSIFRKVILSVQEVAEVTRVVTNYDRANRILAVEFEARLVEGGVLVIRQPDPAFIIDLAKAA